ncbi:hypothetical protein [Flavobacterium sp.]|uniref:hypothetical protein n=1 Tax=Flavobacterium sp. TaxID=239 RepID=UPI001B3E32C8|nr:hypothetical protein [Flavobacterium sp.]MBP6182229.1 hypothetical protein [Flavobacterium sp.]
MEDKKEAIDSKITRETVATSKPRKPRVSKPTEVIEPTIEIPQSEENQIEPFLEEESTLIKLEPKKANKKKKNKMKEKEKDKAKKAKAKEK